ncbi:MAG: YceI family protein [Gammaproteobacteria bacterium]
MKLLRTIAVPLLCLLGACQSPPEPAPPASSTPAAAPIAEATGTTFTIDTQQSWLRILVYKSGRLARFGHNHVISSHAIDGQVVLDGPVPVIALSLPLAELRVDDSAQRAAEGEDFPGEIPDKDRAGTRGNMLGEALLNAQRFPVLSIQSFDVRGDGPEYNVDANVTLAGRSSSVTFPVTVTRDGDTLTATGRTQILHEALGLTPFTALLGALSVRDDIGLHYYFVASRDDET